jgi:uncharacterized protein YbaR (Trm112 family)
MSKSRENLKPQFITVLEKYTKSARLDEMVNELLDVVERESPVVEVPTAQEVCSHMLQLQTVGEDNGRKIKKLVCKHCQKQYPI